MNNFLIHIKNDALIKRNRMKSPKVLIFGAKGWIGGKVCKILKNMSIDVFFARARADDIDSIKRELCIYENNMSKITHVMSFIGRTHGIYENEKITTIDYLEKPGKLVENVRDNLFAPLSLAMICKEQNIHFTYLGTGCIFDYDNDEHPFGEEVNGFTECSKPNFFGSSYSIVKGFTDQLMHQFDESALNVRIRMPITDEVNERNFITKIAKYQKICSIPNSMSVLNELLPIAVDMALNNQTGTINLTNPGLITHNEILQMYNDIVDNNFTWQNFDIDEQNQILLSKRSNNYLDTNKLQQKYPNVRHIKTAVLEILFKMRENIDDVNKMDVDLDVSVC